MTDHPVRIGVLVSGGGTNLQALINSQKKGELKSGKIELVISRSDAYALNGRRRLESGLKLFPRRNWEAQRLLKIG